MQRCCINVADNQQLLPCPKSQNVQPPLYLQVHMHLAQLHVHLHVLLVHLVH